MVLEYFPYDLKKFTDTFRFNPAVYNQKNLKLIMFQIIRGVDYLHSRKFLHRDLKPANILIDHVTLQTKIADFGLSRLYSFPVRPLTKEVLTLWYRAPELMLGFYNYSLDLDMWSVGCIFAEIVIGRPFIQGDSEIDQLFKIFNIFGTPTDETLPGYSSFADYNKNFPRFKGIGLKKYIGEDKMEPLGMDLLEKLLSIDPCKRIPAKEALNHEYFSEFRKMPDSSITPYETKN